MISLKELKYVTTPSYKAPYPGEDYAKETLDNMEEVYFKYEEKYRKKEYSVVFSDSSEMNFEILDSNICHMLGIDYSLLFNGYYDKFFSDILGIDITTTKINSFDLVQEILNNKDKIIDYDCNAKSRVINYYKARIKCAIFDKISDFEKFNFIKLGTDNQSKILFTPSNEVNCPYFFVRLTPATEKNNLKYCVNSLMAPENSEIPNYFSSVAAIPTQILIDNIIKISKLTSTPKEKIDLLNMYKNLILNSSLENKMDISGDYLSLLTEMDIKQKRKTL